MRRLFPANGRNYELFDCSVLFFVLTFVGYVLTTPTAAQEEALRGPFAVFPSVAWGGFMAACALYGIVAAYIPRLVTSGYYVTICATGFWSALFLTGMFFGHAPATRVLILVVLYGWIARRLWREEDREWEPPTEI